MVLALQQERGKPASRFYQIAHRIAGRFEPKVQKTFVSAVGRLKDQIDMVELRQATASGNLSQIEMAAGSGRLQAILLGGGELEDSFKTTSTLTGRAGMDVLEDVTGLDAQFNARHPNVVLHAREQGSTLVAAVGDDVKEAIRIIVAAGADLGLTTTQQARAIREVVGLRPGHVMAPSNLADEIRAGHAAAATSRRLSAVDKARIRSHIAKGTVTEEFIDEMRENYSFSLLNRRAQDIARTETLRSANFGQREAWRQAVEQEVLPANVRRVAVVTPDDRLRFTHAQVPQMNPNGVGLEEPFQTPFGPLMGPPWETNCRCGEGLVFPKGEELPVVVEPGDRGIGTEVFDNRLDRADVEPLNKALMRGIDPEGDVLSATMDERREIKAQISKQLAQDLVDDPDVAGAIDDLMNHSEMLSRVRDIERENGLDVIPTELPFRLQGGDISFDDFLKGLKDNGFTDDMVRRVRQETVEDFASQLVGTWAQTSADSHPLSQAIQYAASDEFGLPKFTAHFGSSMGFGPKNLRLGQIHSKHGAFLRRFVRSQYDYTQAWFAENGIESVTIFRGMRFTAPPGWVQKGGGITSNIELQPLSSFSSEYGVAREFADSSGAVMTAIRVPVDKVLSTARTGFGCLNEGEVVLLGGEYEGFAVAVSDLGAFSNVPAEFWNRARDVGFLAE